MGKEVLQNIDKKIIHVLKYKIIGIVLSNVRNSWKYLKTDFLISTKYTEFPLLKIPVNAVFLYLGSIVSGFNTISQK
jgi:hypothetical protein